MPVLTTYHKLVERDAKNVDFHWKAASIILLVFAIFSSLGISYCFNKIITSFDDHCILDASLTLENVTSTPSHSLNSNEDSSSVVAKKNFGVLKDIFNESYSNFLEKDGSKEYPIEQTRILYDYSINLQKTSWGNKASCDFGVYIPIGQTIFGIIMATMFIICGKGGKSDPQSFLPQPWRIVSPSLVFFIIMTILSIVELIIIEGGINKFCESFEHNLPDIACNVALNRFALVTSSDLVPPGIFRQILTSFNYIAFACWMLSLLVLLARIILVIDFQLVRVTVKTVEFERAQETRTFQAVEIPESGNDYGSTLATTKC